MDNKIFKSSILTFHDDLKYECKDNNIYFLGSLVRYLFCLDFYLNYILHNNKCNTVFQFEQYLIRLFLFYNIE